MATDRPDYARRRWADVLLASSVGTSLFLIFASTIRLPLSPIQNLPDSVLVTVPFLGIVLPMVYFRRRVVVFLGLKQFASYPPLWVAGWIGGAVVLLLAGISSEIGPSIGIAPQDRHLVSWIGVVNLTAASLAAIVSLPAIRRKTAGDSGASRDNDALPRHSQRLDIDFESIETWLRNDIPIVDDQFDFFERSRSARRIASRLLLRPIPAQAVVGRLGSGKSTLRELVASELRVLGVENLHVVPVVLWPYETPRAAVEGVIRALVTALGSEVGSRVLSGLPESYAEAMTAAGGWWSALARFESKRRTPQELLEELDSVATAIDKRYVLWVEDLERFAGVANNQDETLEDSERLQPIRALLLGLQQLNSVSVVTATTSLHARFDLEKIARFVEELPNLSEADVAPILLAFRRGCMARSKTIDPADPTVRKAFDHYDEGLSKQMRAIAGDKSVHGIVAAMCALCQTPRALKQALRSTLDSWGRLEGEIDFDDLLAMTILRESSPRAFATVCAHSERFRRRGSVGEPRVESPDEDWNQELRAAVSEDVHEQSAVDHIVRFVFFQNATLKPQGLTHRNHADYWQRFLSVPDVEPLQSDQRVLRVLAGDSDDEVIALLEGEMATTVEDFERCFATERLLRLLPQVTSRRATELPSSWPGREKEPPGLIPLWRMWVHRGERGELAPEAAFEKIRTCYEVAIEMNLSLVTTIEYFFARRPHDFRVHAILGRDGQLVDVCSNLLRDLLSKTFEGNPAKLANALRGAAPWALGWAVGGADGAPGAEVASSKVGQALAETILEAARLDPDVMLPQVATAITRSTETMRPPRVEIRYELDRAVATGWFGTVDHVLDVFRLAAPSATSVESPINAVLRELDSK